MSGATKAARRDKDSINEGMVIYSVFHFRFAYLELIYLLVYFSVDLNKKNNSSAKTSSYIPPVLYARQARRSAAPPIAVPSRMGCSLRSGIRRNFFSGFPSSCGELLGEVAQSYSDIYKYIQV